jgi:hypothetical protein
MPQQGKRKKVAKPTPAQVKELPSPRRLSGIVDTPDGRHPAWRLSFLLGKSSPRRFRAFRRPPVTDSRE